MLPAADLVPALPGLGGLLASAPWVEIGWGDEDFYRAPAGTPGLALRAVLWPSPAVLHVMPRSAPPAGPEVFELSVAEDGYRRLLAFVARAFRAPGGGVAEDRGPGPRGEGRFYRAGERYYAFYTCNTWVARAVTESGFVPPVRRVLSARGVVSYLERARSGAGPCSDVRRARVRTGH